MLARVIVIAMCMSVRPSVTRRYCVKTKKASGMISSSSGSLKNLVFWRQISSPNSKGFPPNGGLKERYVGKIQRFLPARRYASAGNSDRNVSVCLYVCLFVCLSVTRLYCVKTKKDRWPWMTLNFISLNFQWISRDFADFGRNNR